MLADNHVESSWREVQEVVLGARVLLLDSLYGNVCLDCGRLSLRVTRSESEVPLGIWLCSPRWCPDFSRIMQDCPSPSLQVRCLQLIHLGQWNTCRTLKRLAWFSTPPFPALPVMMEQALEAPSAQVPRWRQWGAELRLTLTAVKHNQGRNLCDFKPVRFGTLLVIAVRHAPLGWFVALALVLTCRTSSPVPGPRWNCNTASVRLAILSS